MHDIIYNAGIRGYYFILKIVSFFHPKAKLFVEGRRGWAEWLAGQIKAKPGKYLWIHAASLGEFEQGRPIIEAIRKKYVDQYRILLTFYSPSGYEVRKDYALADIVMYLPVDTLKNAQTFMNTVQPKLGILIKYEFWFNYIRAANSHKIPLLSVSSIFRAGQVYFKSKHSFSASKLRSIDQFYVQNKASQKLLETIDIDQVTVAGDTRFDRVRKIVAESKELPIADRFSDDRPTMVLGSVWPQDMAFLKPFIDQYGKDIKFIVAPHNIRESDIQSVEEYFVPEKTVRFSEAETGTVAQFDTLVIDNMGMLSSLYRYGTYAYIGGAFGQGLHNILEAVCWLIPVFYGESKRNAKFDEVNAAERHGVGFPVKDINDLMIKVEEINQSEHTRDAISEAAKVFLDENTGATDHIMEGITKILDLP